MNLIVPLIIKLCSLLCLSPACVSNAWTSTPSIAMGIHRHRHSTSSTTSLHAVVSDCFAKEQGKELVERFGSIWEDEVEKVYAFEMLILSGSKGQILHEALDYVEKKRSTFLGKRLWPVRLWSNRATMGCFNRLLDQMETNPTLPLVPYEQQEFGQRELDDEDLTDRQRNLLRLLRILSTYQGGVYALERQVNKNSTPNR